MKNLARLCVLILLILSACSPVKQVLKNPRYFKEVADSVVKRGYCINDTVVKHDTLREMFVIDSPTYIHDTISYAGIVSVLYFDTVFSNGTKVKIQNGKIIVDCPQTKGEKITVKTTSIVRDRRLEALLDKEITSCKSYSDSLKQVVKERDLQIKEIKQKLSLAEFKFWFLIGILLGFAGYKLIKAFRII